MLIFLRDAYCYRRPGTHQYYIFFFLLVSRGCASVAFPPEHAKAHPLPRKSRPNFLPSDPLPLNITYKATTQNFLFPSSSPHLHRRRAARVHTWASPTFPPTPSLLGGATRHHHNAAPPPIVNLIFVFPHPAPALVISRSRNQKRTNQSLNRWQPSCPSCPPSFPPPSSSSSSRS